VNASAMYIWLRCWDIHIGWVAGRPGLPGNV
jgi:hypothetical protein